MRFQSRCMAFVEVHVSNYIYNHSSIFQYILFPDFAPFHQLYQTMNLCQNLK